MIDAHCHLDDREFKGEPTLAAIICASSGLINSKRTVKLAEKYENVYVCVGLGYSPKKINIEKALEKLEKMAKNKRVVGIGEVGMNRPGNKNEISWFARQIELAKKLELPIVIHNRKADAEILAAVGDYAKVMMHCFTGSQDFMERCVERGWYISFGGIVTFKKSEWLRQVSRETPKDKILLETDSPYLAPEPIRGSVNTPANVKIVAQAVAEARGESLEEIDRLTTSNTRRLFGIE